jgi:enoyl-CoA hydratase/carnithine racemase
MRFASREKAILSQFEVGAGIVPGGGPMARLPRLIGRGRALEVLLGADDIPGDLAERYGYVNRSLPDAELDEFVEGLATRIASFDKRVIGETKRFADVASLPPDYEIALSGTCASPPSCGRPHKRGSAPYWSKASTRRATWKIVWATTSVESDAECFDNRVFRCRIMLPVPTLGFRAGTPDWT